MGVKKAKRWCKTKCGRSVTMEQRFAQVENKDRRVEIGRYYSTVGTVDYLKTSAKQENVSMSFMFEKIFLRVMFLDLLKGLVIPVRHKSRRGSANLLLKDGEKTKFPKVYMHPIFLRLLKQEAKQKGISVSFYIYHMLNIYKTKNGSTFCFG